MQSLQSALSKREVAATDRCRARRVEHVMGMPIVVDVRDDGRRRRARRAVRLASLVDATFSTYKDDSEISRLNRGELALDDAHPRRARGARRAARSCASETGGYFDARAAARTLDPSGLVKGWSVDRAAAILDAAGPAQLRGQRRRRHPPRAAARCRERTGASGSSTRAQRDRDRGRGRDARRSRSRPPASTRAATTSSIRTPAGRPTACSRSRSPAPSSRPPTRTRPPRSRWAPTAPRVDGAAARLRGDDDPRRRTRALDARLPPGRRLNLAQPDATGAEPMNSVIGTARPRRHEAITTLRGGGGGRRRARSRPNGRRRRPRVTGARLRLSVLLARRCLLRPAGGHTPNGGRSGLQIGIFCPSVHAPVHARGEVERTRTSRDRAGCVRE